MKSKKNSCTVLILFLVVIYSAGCGPTAFVIKPVPAAQGLNESILQRDDGLWVTDKIAVIDVDGILTNSSEGGLFGVKDNPVSLFGEKLEQARIDQNVKAVVLRINSPGGTVAASDMMYHELSAFKAATNKPVIACILDVGASGGYYIACGCDEIIAGPSSITGSIGTIMQTVSFAGTMNKLGISAEAIKSGQLKDMASPLKDLADEERQVLQAIIMQFYENFLDVVLAGRNGLQRDELRKLADGRVFTSDQAKAAGLIDRIGYPQDAIDRAKKAAGLNNVQVVMYHRPYGYRSNLYSSAAELGTKSLVNIELPQWLRSEGPQFLYLWQIGDLSGN